MFHISYAQNYEDIILLRLFQGKTGFYLDVGAAHPQVDSVTKLFYDRGWKGLNVEPNKAYYDLLVAQRPRDLTVNGAVSDSEGEAVFRFVKNDPKLSSIEPLSAELVQKEKLEVVEQKTKIFTLRKLLQDHNVGPIDFFKIDAEGAESKVLRGFPFEKFKPRAILIESVEAKSTVSTKGQWEDQLLEQGYVSAYFDGINDYYVQKTDEEAIELLSVPLNASDKFLKAEYTTFKFFVKNFRKKLF